MEPLFIQKLERFTRDRGLDIVPFEKGQRKDDVAAEYRKRSGVLGLLMAFVAYGRIVLKPFF